MPDDVTAALEEHIFELLMDETRDAWRVAPILARELDEYVCDHNE